MVDAAVALQKAGHEACTCEIRGPEDGLADKAKITQGMIFIFGSLAWMFQ